MPPRKKKDPLKKEPKTEEEGTSKSSGPLGALESAIKKAFKDEDIGDVIADAEALTRSRPHLPTGSMILDYSIGGKRNKFGVAPCPGLPRGALTQIWGHEGAGKTTVALEAAVETCNSGGTVLYIDWEHALSLDYAAALGVPIDDKDRFRLFQPETFEKGLSLIWIGVKNGVDLVVIDSVGAGVPAAIFKQDDKEKGDMGRVGLVAAKWSKILPELAAQAKLSNSAILAISQVRKKINTQGTGGTGNQPQGGEAWKYYASVRMSFRRIQYELGKEYDPLTHKYVEVPLKTTTMVKIEKCKVAATQGREAVFYLRHGEGIDDLRSVIGIAIAHGIIRKGGAWYTYVSSTGQEIRGQGMDAFKAEIEANSAVKLELYRTVYETINRIDQDNTGSLGALDTAGSQDLSDLDALLSDGGSESEGRVVVVDEGADGGDADGGGGEDAGGDG